MSMKKVRRALGEIMFSSAAEREETADQVVIILRETADHIAARQAERVACTLADQADFPAAVRATAKQMMADIAAAQQDLDALTALSEPPPAPRKRGRKPRAAAANGTAAPESPAPSRPADDPPLPLEV